MKNQKKNFISSRRSKKTKYPPPLSPFLKKMSRRIESICRIFVPVFLFSFFFFLVASKYEDSACQTKTPGFRLTTWLYTYSALLIASWLYFILFPRYIFADIFHGIFFLWNIFGLYIDLNGYCWKEKHPLSLFVFIIVMIYFFFMSIFGILNLFVVGRIEWTPLNSQEEEDE